MKQLLLAAAIVCTVAAQAQSDKYTAAMQQQLQKFDSAKTVADYENIAAAFQRIGDAEKTQWLPYYWQGIALSRIGWMYFPDEKGVTAVKVSDLGSTVDALAARINAIADKADAVAKDNEAKSEILTVRNMAATQQMIVDPQSRYMSYGAQAADDLQKAIQLNPNNPRAAYLQAMSVYGTPEQFGGGKDAAKPLVQKAVELAKAEQVKPLHPRWSLEQSEKVWATYQ
ncbi:hypothetical protein [Parafilimonas terrae]|jgi:hypothetical protein|uniref:Tetratricopeptide repeat-containing protein n=1 Tax=Parafilimonas terrae TaxID=1465490 RepID=A0A1I5VXY8_9BACT|nr:hypothetical protein [Parafilimonas terrae]SFQ12273.1 hypothetical protein SAMN05444277_105251 [Parafilimonas terrae]